MNKKSAVFFVLTTSWLAVNIPVVGVADTEPSVPAVPPATEVGTGDVSGSGAEPQGAPNAVLYRVTASAEELDSYQNTPVGFTAGGYPFRGDPEAPVILVEYSDYLCPFCARHFKQTLPTLLEDYVVPGKVRLVFRDFPIAALHPTAAKGAEAALCVGEQGPVLFWTMHHALFERQAEWNRLPDPLEFLAGVAAEVGADPAAYTACMASEDTAARVEASVAEARALRFNGTPSFQYISSETEETYPLVGAQPVATFVQWADALLAGESPPQPKQPELPIWANAEGLAPDPARPGFTVAGDPYKGNPEAKLAVIEFTDFQCPSCRRHALEAQPAVDEAFVETGEIMWVTKHYPLRTHAQAAVAAVAAECAGDQGKYWEMQHLLYEKEEQWTKAQPDAELLALAEDLGLDMPAFTACFNSRQAMERVLDDIYHARDLVRTTPTFVFVHGGKGAVIRGARKPEDFLAITRRMIGVAAEEQTPAETAPEEEPPPAETAPAVAPTEDE